MPVLDLTIRARELLVIHKIREESLRRGLLFRTPYDMVSGMISVEDRVEKVQLRLKGDFVDHFDTDKWSWRVHVSGDGHVLGLRRFSLQAPTTRRFHRETELFHHFRSEGILAPRYEFVELHLNGARVGVMALEEHFSKELLEAQGRREGVIVRFDEDEFWRDRERNDAILGMGQVSPDRDLSWRTARIRPFREPVVQADPRLQAQADTAIALLRGLQQKRLAPSEVFHVDAMGKFLALFEFWGYWHGLRWHNLRFYMNPFTLKLEPIVFDSTSFKRYPGYLFTLPTLIFARELLADPRIDAAYRRHLSRLVKPDSVDPLVEELRRLEAPLVEQLRVDYSKLPGEIGKGIRSRLQSLPGKGRKPPSPKVIASGALTGLENGPVVGDLPYVSVVTANVLTDEDGRQTIELSTGLKEPVLVTDLTVGSGLLAKPISQFAEVRLPLRLRASSFLKAPHIVRIPLPAGPEVTAATVSGSAEVGSDPGRVYEFTAKQEVRAAEATALWESASLNEVLKSHPFLVWKDRGFTVQAGSWEVDTPVIIPRRVEVNGIWQERPSVTVEPGTQLRFAPSAYFLCHGAFRAEGEEARPVLFAGQSEQSWRGLAVLGRQTPIRLQCVEVRNTALTEDGPWQLTGGCTFYESTVEMRRVTVLGTSAEDALHLMRSSFRMQECTIGGSRSDALDIDFSDGVLEACVFEDVGGDAVDFSGSSVAMRDIKVSRVRDKAVSVGEKSHVELIGLTVDGAGAAVVSKDLSSVTVEDASIANVGFAAFMSYCKKPEYGPASLAVTGLTFDRSGILGMAQQGSKLLAEGQTIDQTELDVEALYERGFMRK